MNFSDSNAGTPTIASQATLRKAIGLAASLLDKFGNSLQFYQHIEAAVVERWMHESFPGVVRELENHHIYAEFRVQLGEYLENLRSASFDAEYIIEHGSVVAADDEEIYIAFSGLMSRIPAGAAMQLDEKSLLLALMVDKHSRSRSRIRHSYPAQSVARHSDIWIRERAWGWCDIRTAGAETSDIGYLLPREHYPPALRNRTDEQYVLAINTPYAIDPLVLVTPRELETVNLAVDERCEEQSLVLGGCPFLIPLVANEETLALFRNHLSVLYLRNGGQLLVEYPWNPVTDYSRYLYPHFDVDLPCAAEDDSVKLDAFREAHPDVV